MKKLILTSAFALGALFTCAQNYDGNAEAIARKALRENGCLDNGAYTFSVETIGFCACGPATTCAWLQVTAYPNPNNNPNIAYKLGPVGRVTLCGDEVLTVECLP